MTEDERLEQLLAMRLILEKGQADIEAGRFCDAFEFLSALERENSSAADEIRPPRARERLSRHGIWHSVGV